MFVFFIRANDNIVISFCCRSYNDRIGGFSAELASIFSSMVSSLVSRMRLLYFSLSVERAVEEN